MAAHESDMVSSIKSLLHFCSSMSLATKEDDQSLFKTLICNTQYVDREKLFASMFGEESYVDWGALAAAHKRSEARKKGNPVGDATVWNNLLSFISGDRKALQKAQQQHVGSSSWLASMISGGSAGGGDSSSTSSSPPRVRYRSFYAVYDAIESTLGSKSGQNMGLDADAMLALSVRAFFILNLMGIVPITALEFMLSKATKKTVTQQAQTIMISVSSEKFTPLQYADTIAWLHSSGVVLVDTVAMRDEILHISTRNKTTEETMKVYSMQVAKQGRPSLMTIAMTASNGRNRKAAEMMRLDADGSSSSSSSSYDTYFAFQGFKYKMRFPTSLSIHMQQQAYWLVSQRDSFGWRTYATYFLDKDLSAKLVEYGDILSPDPSVIAEVLSNTSIVGPPFQDLQLFKQECLGGLPTLERIGITMSESFRLYVAAYQHRHVWKDVWKLIKPILSVQIIKDVEHFVSMRPMDCQSVVSITRYGTCRPPLGSEMYTSFFGNTSIIATTSISEKSSRRGSHHSTVIISPSDSVSVRGGGEDTANQFTTTTTDVLNSSRHTALALAASRALKSVHASRRGGTSSVSSTTPHVAAAVTTVLTEDLIDLEAEEDEKQEEQREVVDNDE